MEIELRNERFSDYPETENVVREAFWNRYSPGCYEHYLIHIMRYSRADDMYADALHVCELYENALSDARGRYIENPVYNIDESQAIEFDKKFEPKELVVGTPSQKRFDRIVAMRRKA